MKHALPFIAIFLLLVLIGFSTDKLNLLETKHYQYGQILSIPNIQAFGK